MQLFKLMNYWKFMRMIKLIKKLIKWKQKLINWKGTLSIFVYS